MNGKWVITSPDAVFSENALYRFKKTVILSCPTSGKVTLTAEARYKLIINKMVVSFGPYKGNQYEKYVDTVDIGKWLKPGENVIEAEVLQLASVQDFSRHRYLSSVQRNGNLAFFLDGNITDSGKSIEIYTDSSWLCARDSGVSFIVPEYAYYSGLGERISVSYKKCLDWKMAKELIKKDEIVFYGETKMWNIAKSDFPRQLYQRCELKEKDTAGNFDFSHIVTGFVRLKAHGKGIIKLTYAECYTFDENGKDIKRKRTDMHGE